MKTPAFPAFAAAVVSLGTLACEEPIVPPGATGGTGGTAEIPDGPGVCEGGKTLYIEDPSNYSYTNTLTLAHSTVKDRTNLTFGWGQITKDFLGHPVDPAQDIDKLLVTLWQLTPAQIADALRQDSLSLSYNAGALEHLSQGTVTSIDLYSLSVVGGDVPEPETLWSFFDTQSPGYEFPQDTHTFLVMAQTGTIAGKNTRMLHTFTLDPSAAETNIELTDASTSLEFTVDLERAQEQQLPLGTADLEFDWSQMTTNSLGNEFNGLQINEAVVAHFSLTRPELEENFLNLREIHDAWYSTTSIAGTSVDLSTLTDDAGAAFPGISAGGLWMVALFCTEDCNSPAPWSITFLEGCP